MRKTILIFDMDGVLVEPRRYRAALAGTIDFFGNLMGWESLYPGEEAIAWFESRGIISEWDIAPLYLAAVFESILAGNSTIQLSSDLISACKSINSANISKPVIEFASRLDELPGKRAFGNSFSDFALQIGRENPQGNPFTQLSNTSLFSTLLGGTRNIQANIVTRVFQEMYLGKEEFSATFHVPVLSEKQQSSLVNDHELISPEWKRNLISKKLAGEIGMAIYTARPSAPKLNKVNGTLEYSPEADFVINQLGWQQVPAVGLGQLKYAADLLGCSTEDLIKPSPVHALGAIGSAISGNFVTAIQAGWDLMRSGETIYYDDFPELDVHIFEDSPTGIAGVMGAVDLLREHGLSINLAKWGISSDKNKVEKLQNLGCSIKATVNDALDAIQQIN